jgi:hypothetical protein
MMLGSIFVVPSSQLGLRGIAARALGYVAPSAYLGISRWMWIHVLVWNVAGGVCCSLRTVVRHTCSPVVLDIMLAKIPN